MLGIAKSVKESTEIKRMLNRAVGKQVTAVGDNCYGYAGTLLQEYNQEMDADRWAVYRSVTFRPVSLSDVLEYREYETGYIELWMREGW